MSEFSLDTSGVDVCTPQKTPVCTLRDDTYIYFGFDVELQIPIEKLPRSKFNNLFIPVLRKAEFNEPVFGLAKVQ